MRVIYFLLSAVIYPFVAPFYLDRASVLASWRSGAGLCRIDDFLGQRSLPVTVLGGDPASLLEAMKQLARRRDYPRLIACAEELYGLSYRPGSHEPLCHLISSLATMKSRAIPSFVARLAPVLPENERSLLFLAQSLRLGWSVDQSLIGSAKCVADRYRCTSLAVGHFPATIAFIRAIENLQVKPSSANYIRLPDGQAALTKLSRAQLMALLLAIRVDRSLDLLLLATLDGNATHDALAREGWRMLEVLLANSCGECSSDAAVLMDRFIRKQFTLISPDGREEMGAFLESKALEEIRHDSKSSSSLVASLRLNVQRQSCVCPSLTKILIVGEGDFSFSGALKTCLKEERVQIVSSTLEADASSVLRRYPSAAHGSLIAEGSSMGDSPVFLFNVDACRIKETLLPQLPSELFRAAPAVFSAVLFTFPYADTHREEISSPSEGFDTYYIAKGRHKDLLRGFLQSARTVLARDSRVYIALLLSQIISWEVEHIARQCGYELVDIYPFSSELFAGLGYRRRRTYNSDTFASSSLQNRPMIAESQLLSSWLECMEDAFVVELSAIRLRKLNLARSDPIQNFMFFVEMKLWFVVITLLLLVSVVSFRPISIRSLRLPLQSTLFSSRDSSADLTKTIFDSLQKIEGVGGSGGSSSYEALKSMDSAWKALKDGGWAKAGPQFVFDYSQTPAAAAASPSEQPFDVIVCGGTLGIFYAAALQKRGFRVAVVEKNRVAGRAQEWNISEKELLALTREGLLTEKDLHSLISVKFNPARVGFRLESSSGADGWQALVSDVLNLGVRPDGLVNFIKKVFEDAGGAIFENVSMEKVEVYSDAAQIVLKGGARLSTRLLLDAMGHSSPIAKQFRGPIPPDGICIVVGSCARGYPAANNTCSDIIFSDNPPIPTGPSHDLVQYFWEAFPSGSGPQDRTTYLFAYMDAQASRPGVEDMLRDYWELLPRYQGMPLDDLTFLRVLYGVFPTYRSSPLRPKISRILQVGDASGIQSPLSFGGFGSLTRHLPRILAALDDALLHNLLTADDLGEINSYQPNLSACWMFQKAMSVPAKVKGQVEVDLVTSTLRSSFRAMEQLGDSTMRPFLQDVVQFKPLVLTLLTALRSDWSIPVRVLPLIGFAPLVDFVRHLIALGIYDVLHRHVSEPLSKWVETSSLPMRQKYWWRRRMEAWKYGSGLDYNDH